MKIRLALGVLVLGVLACGSRDPMPKMNLYATSTVQASQTPYIVVITETPNAPDPTQTAAIIIVTDTPNSLCVSATSTVYLRPSPNTDNYPVTVIPNAAIVEDLGGRNGAWTFVGYKNYEGWINSDYLKECEAK